MKALAEQSLFNLSETYFKKLHCNFLIFCNLIDDWKFFRLDHLWPIRFQETKLNLFKENYPIYGKLGEDLFVDIHTCT